MTLQAQVTHDVARVTQRRIGQQDLAPRQALEQIDQAALGPDHALQIVKAVRFTQEILGPHLMMLDQAQQSRAVAPPISLAGGIDRGGIGIDASAAQGARHEGVHIVVDRWENCVRRIVQSIVQIEQPERCSIRYHCAGNCIRYIKDYQGENVLRQIIVTLCWLPLSLLALSNPANAVEPAAAQVGAASPRQGGALFKVQRAGQNAYVFGTIHVGRADFYPFDDKVLQALQHSTSVALEIDPGNTQGLAALMTRYGTYADGKSLARELPQPLQQQLNPLLEKYGLTPAAVANMKPWLLATVLGISEYTYQGYLPQYGVDSTLAVFAKNHGKPLVELETAEQQLSLLGKLTSTEQLQFLQDSIDEIQDPEKAQRSLQLITLWRDGDVEGLTAMLAELTSDDTFTGKFVQRALLDERNPGLADGIAKLAGTTPHAFVGIGMLHLVGKNSVLAILRQRGYTVTRIY